MYHEKLVFITKYHISENYEKKDLKFIRKAFYDKITDKLFIDQ